MTRIMADDMVATLRLIMQREQERGDFKNVAALQLGMLALDLWVGREGEIDSPYRERNGQ